METLETIIAIPATFVVLYWGLGLVGLAWRITCTLIERVSERVSA